MLADIDRRDTGKNIVIGGLVVQILFFGLFVITSMIFHVRLARAPTAASLASPWAKYMWALYGASLLILIRSLFRIFEFAGGSDGELMSKEFYIYIFDAALMFLCMCVFNVVHPGAIIGGKKDAKRGVPLEGLESARNSFIPRK